MHSGHVLIVDFGSQYTQLIARRIRECRVFCEILPCHTPLTELAARNAGAIVLSGGPSSVYDAEAPTIDPGVFDLGVPILGICYGMQLTAHLRGGRVEKAEHREYGHAKVTVLNPSGIFGRLHAGDTLDVWMSHGDRVAALPPGLSPIGESANAPLCAVGDDARKLYGLQFHPEVAHTPRGREILEAFLFDVAKLEPNWTSQSFVDASIQKISAAVGENDRVVLGLSGGVDSTVAAVLCERALGKRLACIFVDNGLLRQGEGDAVEQMFRDHFNLQVRRIDAQAAFLSALEGVTDPEKKRKIIGKVFIDVFDAAAHEIDNVTHLVQGTLYPDVIESVSVRGPSAVIKSHHNVGGLPERMKLKLLEPLRELFKDEVRAVGTTLGIPHHALWRHPFPGPGLAVRCLGALTPARLEALRKADAIFDEELRAADLYQSVWQSFAVLLPVRSVGVMGDDRTYEETIALRAIHSTDGMTADWARLPYELLAKASSRIINEVRGVNRVVYDISSKPPATIEWE